MRIRIAEQLAAVGILTAACVGWAAPHCPSAVTETAARTVPNGKIVACKAERERGKQQFEVKLDSVGKQIELDISPEGTLLLTEERVRIETVPLPVMVVLAAKYPGAKAERAEKQTKPDGSVTYELAFVDKGKRREATFRADGVFIEQE